MRQGSTSRPTDGNGRVAIYVALLTPLSPDGRLDVAALQAHVGTLLDEGVDGFLIGGTTGEGPLLEDEDVVLATRAVVESCAGCAVAMTQVGRPSTAATTRLLERALEAGANAVMAVPPYYYALDDAQVEAHYAALMRCAGKAPLFAYAIPRRTGNDLPPELVRRLASLGLFGIKDSTRSLDRHRDYLRIRTESAFPSFAVYMGSDGLVLPAIEAGSNAVVSAVANARPDLLLALRAAAEEGRTDDARRFQAELESVRESVSGVGSIAALKAVVAARMAPAGVAYSTAVRAPLGIPA